MSLALFTPATGQATPFAQPPPLNLSQPGWPVPTTTLNWEADTRLRRLEQGLDNPGGYIVTPEMFGAVGDGVTNDTTAVQAAINDVSVNGPGEVYLLNSYYLTAPLVMAAGVSLVGGIEWPPFFTPQPISNLVVAAGATQPFITVPAGMTWFRIQGIAMHATGGVLCSSQPIVFQGTAANPIGQFLLKNIVCNKTGGMVFNYAQRFRMENVCIQGWNDVYCYDFENCTIMRWDWISGAASGTGTTEGANWTAYIKLNNSGSVLSTGNGSTGVPLYGLWGNNAVSSNFYNLEINGVVQDVVHLTDTGTQWGDINFYRLYNNGQCTNAIYINSTGLANDIKFMGGVIGTIMGSAIFLTCDGAANHVLNDIDISDVSFNYGTIATNLPTLVSISGRVSDVDMVNNHFAVFNLGSAGNTVITVINDTSNTPSANLNTFIGNAVSGNLGAAAGRTYTANVPQTTVQNTTSGQTGGWSIMGNPGLMLSPAQPAVPTSGTDLVNRNGYDCFLNIQGGTITAITVNGQAWGSVSGMVPWPTRGRVRLTYSVAPTTFVAVGMQQ